MISVAICLRFSCIFDKLTGLVVSGSKESDGNGVSSTTSELSVTVRLPFHYSSGSHGKGVRKRVSNALNRSDKTLSTLKDENVNLRNKFKTIQKRLCRNQTKTTNPHKPRRKTNLILKKSGINPKSVPDIRKCLI
jgi:formyltetrahydrofolate synthetase